MDKKNTRILLIYVSLVLIINIFLVTTLIDWSDWADRPTLDFSKDFANEVVMTLQNLAVDLGVAEKANVKQALAKLHYDVYLAGNSKDLAGIIQNTASDTRGLIVSEFVNSSAEQVLRILNGTPEVQTATAMKEINIVPLPEGGCQVQDPHGFSPETLEELSKLSTLFTLDTFRNNYESYRSQATLKIVIEEGVAQRAIPKHDQDTIKYWEREIQNLRNEYSKISKQAGLAESSGPGISISLQDKYFPLQAGDLRRIVSELFSAGASAIAVSGHRLAVNSYIIDQDAGICIDGFTIRTNPIEITVLGDPETLLSGIDLLFNVVFKDMFYADMESHENIVLSGKGIQ